MKPSHGGFHIYGVKCAWESITIEHKSTVWSNYMFSYNLRMISIEMQRQTLNLIKSSKFHQENYKSVFE